MSDDEWAAQHLFDRIATLEAALAEAKETIEGLRAKGTEREQFIRENAGPLLAQRDAKIERQRRRLAQLEMSQSDKNRHIDEVHEKLLLAKQALTEARREYEGPMAEEIQALKQERTEDRAAIRRALEALYVVHMHHETCGACIGPYIDLKDQHAAAIARALEVAGEGR